MDLMACDHLDEQAAAADRVIRQAEVEIQRTLGRVIEALEASPPSAALKAAIEPLAQAVIKAGKTAADVGEAVGLIDQAIAAVREKAAREAEAREQRRQAELFRPNPSPDAVPPEEGAANARAVVEQLDDAATSETLAAEAAAEAAEADADKAPASPPAAPAASPKRPIAELLLWQAAVERGDPDVSPPCPRCVHPCAAHPEGVCEYCDHVEGASDEDARFPVKPAVPDEVGA